MSKKDSKLNKTVIVLGFQRSGTSVTAGVLSILGVDMGNVGKVVSINPKGSFEDQDFVKLGKKIINASLNQKKYKHLLLLFANVSQANIKKVGKRFNNEIRTLINNKSKGKKIWGFKYPALYVTFDLFIKHIKNPYLVVIIRNPVDVVKSANKSYRNIRQRKSFIYKLQIVNNRVGKIIDICNKYHTIPQIFISFEDLVTDPVQESKRLSKFLGIKMNSKHKSAILNFVIPRTEIKKQLLIAKIAAHIKIMTKEHQKSLNKILKSKDLTNTSRKEAGRLLKIYRRKYLHRFRDLTSLLKSRLKTIYFDKF